jgi:hypothetical protein
VTVFLVGLGAISSALYMKCNPRLLDRIFEFCTCIKETYLLLHRRANTVVDTVILLPLVSLVRFSDQGFNPRSVDAELTWKDGLTNPEICFSDTDARLWVDIWGWLFWAAADRWPNSACYAPFPWTGVPR